MTPKGDISRREFLAPAAAGLALTLVPRHVLGGPGYVAPSDKITLAYIGCGTQGTREMLRLIATPGVQITAVCDPVKNGTNYIDWDKTGIRDSVRKVLENPDWGAGVDGIRGGRDMAKEIIETYYAKKRASESFKGVASYADFRELLEKEKDLDSVKIMTPDHLHATISIAAMKKGKHVLVHKPLANRVAEIRMVVETARKTGVATHLLAWHRPNNTARDMILDGVIGTLREVHNWTDRPYWPQASTGTCGWGHRSTGPIIPVIPMRCFGAGTNLAPAASPTWGTTASGPSSRRLNCRFPTASKLNAAPVAKSMIK